MDFVWAWVFRISGAPDFCWGGLERSLTCSWLGLGVEGLPQSFSLGSEETLPPAGLMKLWHKKAAPALTFRPELGLGGGQALEEPASALYTTDL